MTNSWEILSKARAAELPKVSDKKRCTERLAGDRCLLGRGHEGQHASTAGLDAQEVE